jgi:hypothetical protein
MSPLAKGTAIVLGAGFSKCAGLPLTSGLSDHLLSDEFGTPLDVAITSALRMFLRDVFQWSDDQPLPALEECSTMIDLSANSGHHLGARFAPSVLRAIRRVLIYRVFSVLDRRFSLSPTISAFLESELTPASQTHFIVLNWDIVLERHLEQMPGVTIDYGIESEPWAGGPHDVAARTVKIAKVHGSSNWVYCDNCRTLYYDIHRKISLRVGAGLLESDFRLFDERFGTHLSEGIGIEPQEPTCTKCGCSVGPHIATFSYRKSFRTHAFASSWLTAEQILSNVKRWIFVGYSMPEADFEFKHLLKTCQMKFQRPSAQRTTIEVVLRDSPEAEASAIFRQLFN